MSDGAAATLRRGTAGPARPGAERVEQEPVGGPRAPSARRRFSWARLGVALAAGVVAGFCFPPFDLGLLVVVPVAALLWTWRDARAWHAALYGFAFGVGCYGVVLEWVRYFGAVAIVPFVAVMAAYVALVALGVAALARRGVRSPLLTAAAWVVMEWVRGRVPVGGFSWADVGVALHDLTPARALASFGGVPLVSFLVVAAAGFAIDLVTSTSGARHARVLAAAGLAATLLLAVVADVARYDTRVTGHLRVAMLQGDDQELSLAQQQDQLLTTDHLDLASRLRGHYDLIVFPEGALDTDPQLDPGLHARLAAIAREHGASVLVNARTPAPNGHDFNSNLMYGPDGRYQGRYSKQHLVPFGEYVPWRDSLGFIGELRQIPYDFERGHRTVVFRAAGHRVGTVICFESAFAPLVRDSVRKGAEVVVVSTNNRSYHRSGNSEQHLANSQLRAAETGRPVLQASVSGISAVIDPDGTVHDTTGLFEKAIVSTTIATRTGETPYVRFGDWVVLLSALALVIAAGVAVARASRAPA
ncbi:MAG TPA: apolipoprotein N-acyltransferase [Acidimicrobiia bacterium]